MKHSELEIQLKPELRNLKLLNIIYIFLIVSLVIMPQYFGVHLGYDFTCSRFSNIFLAVYMILCPMILTHFWKTTLRCASFYPLLLYVAVAGYTMVFRTDVNAFFLVFLEVYTFLLLIYGIRYVVGYKKTLKLIIGCAYFLAVYGFVEFIYGKSLFLQFFSTMPTQVINSYRSGHYRIMGPCGHSLAYGLLLLLFIAVTSYDYDADELNLFRRPLLLVMLLVNVFLTGSRSTLGIAVLECILILAFSKGETFKKSLIILGFSIVTASVLLFMLQGTGVGKYFLGQVASVIDQAFDTNLAANYGIDSQTLENSTMYRKALPYIFTLDWLNPLLGRGSYFGGAYVHGTYVHSIDNYYVVQYIKYAYPGLVCYVLFMLTTLIVLINEIIRYKSGIAKMTLIGAFCYFLNLWWVDSLQTLKFMYLFLAVFFAYQLERKDKSARLRKKEIANRESKCDCSGI